MVKTERLASQKPNEGVQVMEMRANTVRTQKGGDTVTEIKGWGGDETERRPEHHVS